MSIHFGFDPDPVRARALDRAMHTGLADSLDHIREQSRGIVPFDDDAIARLAGALRNGGRFTPSTFGLYYDLVPALLEGDHAAARALFKSLSAEQPIDTGIGVYTLDGCRDKERYCRLMDTDPAAFFKMNNPSADVAQAFRRRFVNAMVLLDEAAPELAGEIRAIISELIMVVGDKDSGYEFDGGSSYMLWGALFLNAASHHTEVDLIEVLAHESAHSLLFGFSTEEPLVENDDSELYPSPLRQDPRPMDGIYHSTFVSARMHWVLSRLLETGILDDDARKAAIKARDRDRDNFEEGYGVVEEHGRLTGLGKAVMEEAHRYMDRME